LNAEAFQQAIRDAAARGTALRLRGGGSKDFYGNAGKGEVLDTRGYAGVVAYEPTELVITARCGTTLRELEDALARENQFLPFEPPHFGAATLGGCIAAGLSGPRRASAGAVRDFVLGAKMIDGAGRLLGFGGQVMKNVAGYDIARLLTGSLGTLGLIMEVSLKVLPRPPAELSLRFALAQEEALERLNRWAGQPLPISASAWAGNLLTLRLSGAQSALRAAKAKLGGEALEEGAASAFWGAIREQTDPFFSGDAPLWRLSLPAAVPALDLAGSQLLEWNGALRWLRSGADAATVRAAAQAAGGHATLFRNAAGGVPAFAPLSPVLERLHRDLTSVFDPAGILNPGRLSPSF
jgi:glycolate oxidase FAD binding subunit